MLIKINKLTFTKKIIVEFVVTISNHCAIEFERRHDLIYHLNRDFEKIRLCISRSIMKEVFFMTHDEQAHVDFHRVFAFLSKTPFIRRLTHYLRKYIAHCLDCLLNQIKRHKLYDSLNSISIENLSFHIVIMKFILTLSSSDHEKFDFMLTIIDKFTKVKLFISGLTT